MTRATFTRMRDGTAEEYALIFAREAAYNRTLHLRVLDAVRPLGAAEPDPGYPVSRLAHSLQPATPGRAGRPARRVRGSRADSRHRRRPGQC
jgi:hypothetical protein